MNNVVKVIVCGLAAFVCIVALLSTTKCERQPQSSSAEHTTVRAVQLVDRFFPTNPQSPNGQSVVSIVPAGSGFAPSATEARTRRGIVSTFPSSLADPFQIVSENSSLVCRADAGQTETGIAAGGNLVYKNGLAGCDVLYRSTPSKTEEFICIEKAGSEQRSWSWTLELGKGNDALTPHLTGIGSVELSRESGSSGLRIDPPYGKDAAGQCLKVGGRLSYSLCTISAGRVKLTLNANLRGLSYPVVIDPSFSSTGNLNTARENHSATLLKDGKVLVAGGSNGVTLASCEIYDPAANNGAGAWSVGPNLITARLGHTAVLLKDGRVLVVGGLDLNSVALASAEIFDPAANNGAGQWSSTGAMNTARSQHAMEILPSGKVVVAGGVGPLASVEVFDPAANGNVGAWSAAGNLNTPRQFFTATTLNDGRVLFCGGNDNNGNTISSAEIYDPAGNGGLGSINFTQTSMPSGRYSHIAALLPSGDVLMAGGFNLGLFPSADVLKIHDAATNLNLQFNSTGSMSRVRTEHRAVTLANGNVVVAGCHDGSFANVEYYDPLTASWVQTGSMIKPHTKHTFTLLADGRALVAGGFVGSFLNSSEIFDPRSEPIAQVVTANGIAPLAITLSAASMDDNPSTFAVLSQPSNGTLSGTAPNLVFTANPGYSGMDTFTFNSNDFFGLSKPGSITISVNSLVPAISGTHPDAQIVGSTAFTVTVNGSNFVMGSVVKWNGLPRTTTFVSTSQLTASIPASDVSTQGTANITVVNPIPGGGTSAAQIFNVVSGTLGNWVVLNTNDSGLNSLRSAMNNIRANETISFDPVAFDLVNSDAATVINVLSPLPNIDQQGVKIDAQNRRVSINGAGAGSTCGFTITSGGVSIMGLSIVGFTQSGICINGGSNNTLGGNRALPDVNTGPNGQGLRISGCGTFGIEITNVACNNVVKGCWIGLDNSGINAEPNLAGILIHGQSCKNLIGSTVPDEANVISGNQFEGMTVSDAGTDDNIVVGNIIGAAAIAPGSRSVASREVGALLDGLSAVGNGSAGVFLSKGTNNTQVGGTDTGQGNAIGNNGGNGIEVRSIISKKNSAHHNGISKNHKGGIALFDGSNNDIKPPKVIHLELGSLVPGAASHGAGLTGLSSVEVKVTGTADTSDGSTVEIFNDSGGQGNRFVTSALVTNGQFQTVATVDPTQTITATVTDPSGNTSPFAIFGTPPGAAAPSITTPLLANATLGANFSLLLTANGTQPITFTAAPLPDGLTIANGLISGTPTTGGTYTVNLTATSGAGTQAKSLVLLVAPAGTLPAVDSTGAFYPLDSDQDGVLDVLENLAATDPHDPADRPADAGVFSVNKAVYKLSFTKATGDGLQAEMNLALPSGFVLSATTLSIMLGGVEFDNFVLDGKGKASLPAAAVQLSIAKGTKPATIKLAARNSNLKARVALSGMLNATNTPGVMLKIPVAVSLRSNSQKYIYTGSFSVYYIAKKDKKGSATLVQ